MRRFKMPASFTALTTMRGEEAVEYAAKAGIVEIDDSDPIARILVDIGGVEQGSAPTAAVTEHDEES